MSKAELLNNFFDDAVNAINDKFNLQDTKMYQFYYNYEKNGWYYYLSKSVNLNKNFKNKIKIKRTNYRQGKVKYYNDKPVGKRIIEEAYIYTKKYDINKTITEFSLDQYSRSVF